MGFSLYHKAPEESHQEFEFLAVIYQLLQAFFERAYFIISDEIMKHKLPNFQQLNLTPDINLYIMKLIRLAEVDCP